MKSIITSLKRGKVLSIIAATLAPLMWAPVQAAPNLVDGPYCVPFAQSSGTWTVIKDLPKFNKNGILQKTTISLSVDITGSSLSVQNTVNASQTASADVQVYFLMTSPGTPAPLNSLSLLGAPSQSVSTVLAPNDGIGPDYSAPDGAVLGVSASTSVSKSFEAPADLSSLVGAGTFPIKVQVYGVSADVSGGNFRSGFQAFSTAQVCIIYEYNLPPEPIPPSLGLIKSASKLTLAPYEKCTYTYLVQNTGGTDLFNIVVTDDNATPNYSGDDFVVGTVASLPSGQSATLTATVVPPICLDGVLSTGPTVSAGKLIPEILANGDVKVTFLQDFDINDNTYGTGCVGWGGTTHTFGNLTGSDKLEFRFFDAANKVVMDVYLDTISQTSGVNWAGGSYSYPSGYGTYGPFGGEGSFVSPFSTATDGSKIVAFYTSISENLNNAGNLPKKATLIVNSPTSDDGNGNPVVDPVKAPGGWESVNVYSCTVKGSIFAAGGGFGKVTIPDQHNSPAKQGGHVIVPFPVPCYVTNVALAHTPSAGGLDASSKAVVSVGTPQNTVSGWISADVGRPKKKGSSAITGTPPAESFSIDGGGKDIGGGNDQFQYLYQIATADCSITAKVLSVEKTENRAAAGVEIRESVDSDSKHFGMFVTPADGIHLECRGASPAQTKITGPTLKAPYWVRVTRSNNTFQGEYSADGTTWITLGTRTITMTANVNVGLGVCSHKDGELCTSTFDNVTLGL